MLIAIFVMFFSFNLSAEFDNKCSILITLRFQNNENAYADALDKINQCNKLSLIHISEPTRPY